MSIIANIKLIYVYFPRFSSYADYIVDLGKCFGFIENVVQPRDNIIIIADVNFARTTDHPDNLQLETFLINVIWLIVTASCMKPVF
jgi:hypothetical protein